jgi:hypothetical protein
VQPDALTVRGLGERVPGQPRLDRLKGGPGIACPRAGGREALAGERQPLRPALALLGEPGVELVAVRLQTLKKVAAPGRDRLCEAGRRERWFEGSAHEVEVALDARSQGQALSGGRHHLDVAAEAFADVGQGAAQVGPAALGIRVRPEERREDLSRLRPVDRQPRDEEQGVARCEHDRAPVALELGVAQEAKQNPAGPCHARVTARLHADAHVFRRTRRGRARRRCST